MDITSGASSRLTITLRHSCNLGRRNDTRKASAQCANALLLLNLFGLVEFLRPGRQRDSPPAATASPISRRAHGLVATGDYKTGTPLKVDFDEWVRFGFKEPDAAYHAEAERIAAGFVEPPDAEWQR